MSSLLSDLAEISHWIRKLLRKDNQTSFVPQWLKNYPSVEQRWICLEHGYYLDERLAGKMYVRQPNNIFVALVAAFELYPHLKLKTVPSSGCNAQCVIYTSFFKIKMASETATKIIIW